MFQPAVRTKVKLKIALTGPSGSGKTYSALSLAKGLGSKIAVLDTENGSASLYAGIFKFDTLSLAPPYTVAKYNQAIKDAVGAGYEVLIIDSISHAWAGEGGLLAKKESLDSTGKGNSYTNWATVTKEHEAFKAGLLNAPIHLISTIRSKQDYSQEVDEKTGKKIVRKLGLAPVQRDGIEYEFTTVFDLTMTHEATVSKDRTGLFDGLIFRITEEVGKELIKWLSTAKGESNEHANSEQSKSSVGSASGTNKPSGALRDSKASGERPGNSSDLRGSDGSGNKSGQANEGLEKSKQLNVSEDALARLHQSGNSPHSSPAGEDSPFIDPNEPIPMFTDFK